MSVTNEGGDLRVEAVSTLRAYFQSTDPDKHDETRAKIAASVFSTCTREMQANGARDALHWSMAQVLFSKEQQQEYIRATQPGSALTKALPEGGTEKQK